jgi:hypothetical protein
MRLLSHLGILLGGCSILAGAVCGQLSVPVIVQLPTEDFVWSWGDTRPIDDRERPEFTTTGGEAAFRCTATGTFKPGSRMRDFYNMREFEQSLNGTLYFIQVATATLNDLYLSNDLQWATLDCAIPETIEPEEAVQEQLDRAVERAERERERRRKRDAEAAE